MNFELSICIEHLERNLYDQYLYFDFLIDYQCCKYPFGYLTHKMRRSYDPDLYY